MIRSAWSRRVTRTSFIFNETLIRFKFGLLASSSTSQTARLRFQVENLWADRDQRQTGGVGGSASDAVPLSWGIDDRQIGAIVVGQLEGLSQAPGLCRDDDGNSAARRSFHFAAPVTRLTLTTSLEVRSGCGTYR